MTEQLPQLQISEQRVSEMIRTWDTYQGDLGDYERSFLLGKAGALSVIKGAGNPRNHPTKHTASYMTLQASWRMLSSDEKVSLTALALFEPSRGLAWNSAYGHAERIIEQHDEHYQMHLGVDWIEGLHRYQSELKPHTA